MILIMITILILKTNFDSAAAEYDIGEELVRLDNDDNGDNDGEP